VTKMHFADAWISLIEVDCGVNCFPPKLDGYFRVVHHYYMRFLGNQLIHRYLEGLRKHGFERLCSALRSHGAIRSRMAVGYVYARCRWHNIDSEIVTGFRENF